MKSNYSENYTIIYVHVLCTRIVFVLVVILRAAISFIIRKWRYCFITPERAQKILYSALINPFLTKMEMVSCTFRGIDVEHNT